MSTEVPDPAVLRLVSGDWFQESEHECLLFYNLSRFNEQREL